MPLLLTCSQRFVNGHPIEERNGFLCDAGYVGLSEEHNDVLLTLFSPRSGGGLLA